MKDNHNIILILVSSSKFNSLFPRFIKILDLFYSSYSLYVKSSLSISLLYNLFIAFIPFFFQGHSKKVKGWDWNVQTQLETRTFLAWFRLVVLSYIHIDGDFNPRRVTVERVHGGLHPRRVHEEAILSIPAWPSRTKDLPH